MLIDWFTVGASLINFLILVLLLKRFLYGPIIKAMDEREARIASEIQAAEQKQKEAWLERESYRQKNLEWEHAREEMLHQAREELDAWRKERVRKAHQEVEEAQAHWQRALQQEREAFLQEVRQRACHQTYVIARKALADLADADLERRIVEVFIERLSTLEDAQREAISSSIQQSGGELVANSAFELDQETRQQVQAAAQQHLAGVSNVRFETLPDLVCGIELRTQGQRLAWSLADYLAALEVNNLLP